MVSRKTYWERLYHRIRGVPSILFLFHDCLYITLISSCTTAGKRLENIEY